MPLVQHGLVQKALIEASSLKRMIREAPDGWQLWIDESGWIYVGKFTRRQDIDTFLVAQLTQDEV